MANYRDMLESRISVGGKEKLPTRASGKPDAEVISSWSYDMEGHAKKCVENISNWQNETTQKFFEVVTPCMDDHQFKEEETKSVEEFVHSLLTICAEISVSGSYWETWLFMVCE